MNFASPQTEGAFEQRDQLLMDSLRPDPLPFRVRDEYPIVLDPAHAEFSHVIEEDGEIVAHANLWPRVISDRSRRTSIPIGLIGNVATSAKKRAQGYMSRLMDHLKHKSEKMGLNALILWSDRHLHPFYQKFGFTSLGREFRFYFRQRDLLNISYEPKLASNSVDRLHKKELKRLLDRRYVVPYTLERSPEEFSALLRIPALNIFIQPGGGYFLMGKGYDCVGVIHEWGAETPMALLGGIQRTMTVSGREDLILLAPGSLASSWTQILSNHAVRCETHPMALCHQIKAGTGLSGVLKDLFIWGLDSI